MLSRHCRRLNLARVLDVKMSEKCESKIIPGTKTEFLKGIVQAKIEI